MWASLDSPFDAASAAVRPVVACSLLVEIDAAESRSTSRCALVRLRVTGGMGLVGSRRLGIVKRRRGHRCDQRSETSRSVCLGHG